MVSALWLADKVGLRLVEPTARREGTMGDTQRSPTISTENQGIAAKVAGDSGQGLADPPGDGPALFEGESSLVRIKMLPEIRGRATATN